MTPRQRRVLSIRLSALLQFVLAAQLVASLFLLWMLSENEVPGDFLAIFLISCRDSSTLEFLLVSFGGFFGFYLFHPWVRAVVIALIISASVGICALYGLKGILSGSALLAMSVRGMLVMSEARGYKTVREFYDDFFPPRLLLLGGLTVLITGSALLLDAIGLDVLEERSRVERSSRRGNHSTHEGLFDANPHIPILICAVYFTVFGLADFRRRPPPQPPRSLLDPPATPPS